MKTGWFVVNANNYIFEPKLEDNYFPRIQKYFLSKNTKLEKCTNIEVQVLLNKGVKPDFCYYMDKDVNIVRKLENQGVRCFDNADVIEICDDKAKSFNFIEKINVNQPKTIFGPLLYDNEYDLDKFINNAIEYLGENIIVKDCVGTCGNEIRLAHGFNEIKEKILAVPKHKMYLLQEQIKNSYGKDIRVHMIKDKVYGAILRENLAGDFRSNISRGGKATKIQIDRAVENMCCKIARELGSDFLGIDVLIDKNDYKICEINSNSYYILENNPLSESYAEDAANYMIGNIQYEF